MLSGFELYSRWVPLVTLRVEGPFYIHGQNNILALMTLRKAIVWNVSFLLPLAFFMMRQQKKRIALSGK